MFFPFAKLSSWAFAPRAACLFVIVSAAANTVFAQDKDYENLSTASGNFNAVRILDTNHMPIGKRGSWGKKTLFDNGEAGHLQLVYIPPGAPGAYVHYHEFHEWAWIVSGDFTNNESTHPNQVSGPLQRFVAGDFLSRPPYSLHGGELGRQEFMASQIGSVILIMEEGVVSEKTFSVDPACAQKVNKCYNYNDRHAEIEHWAVPRIIDTLNEMPFQAVEGSPGLKMKYLAADPLHGFRATMWYLEAGAETPEQFRPHYYEQAHQFNFIINGDLTIQTYSDGETPAESFTVSQNYSVERPPMSVFGLAKENATKGGVVWLEVTYAKGTTWTTEYTPIGEPEYVSP
jgi:mannose-6-phosphate isomerase-like protein (cupin superfamily)